MRKIIFVLILSFAVVSGTIAGENTIKFRVVAFYKAKNEQAHISFVRKANKWFSEIADKYNFVYEATDNWNNLNQEFLSHCHVVIFLDAKPDLFSRRPSGFCW